MNRRRVIVKHHLMIQRWRVATHLRVFRGNGLANFEFEFRLGFPRHSPKTVAAHDAIWNTVEIDSTVPQESSA